MGEEVLFYCLGQVMDGFVSLLSFMLLIMAFVFVLVKDNYLAGVQRPEDADGDE